jgi:hypothetical protein
VTGAQLVRGAELCRRLRELLNRTGTSGRTRGAATATPSPGTAGRRMPPGPGVRTAGRTKPATTAGTTGRRGFTPPIGGASGSPIRGAAPASGAAKRSCASRPTDTRTRSMRQLLTAVARRWALAHGSHSARARGRALSAELRQRATPAIRPERSGFRAKSAKPPHRRPETRPRISAPHGGTPGAAPLALVPSRRDCRGGPGPLTPPRGPGTASEYSPQFLIRPRRYQLHEYRES